MANTERKDSALPVSPVRRPRAPTITIDTSTVHPTETDNLSPRGLGPRRSSQNEDSAPAQLDSRSNRPTSPHNVSSPTSKSNDQAAQNFLSVPGLRSRGNSVDSDLESHPSSSFGGETFLGSPSQSTQGGKSHPDTLQGNDGIMSNEEALTPDPGTEDDFKVENNKFAFSPGHLGKLINPKSGGAFYALGGLVGLEKGLQTNRQTGLSIDEKQLSESVSFETATKAADSLKSPKATSEPTVSSVDIQTSSTARRDVDGSFADRKRVFKDNRLPEKKAKNIFQLAWMAYNDKVLILLTIAAVISLALGLYQTFGQSHKDGEAPIEWVEGVAIMAAVIIVVVVGAANDWQKERQFVKLNKKKEDRFVKVIRSGRSQEVSIHDILVGDVLHLEPGDMIPADGIFIGGHNIKCDESSATGESDLLRKTAGDDVYNSIRNHEDIRKMDPFILSGSKVTEGIGTFLVTATGVNSSYGKMMLSLQDDPETTPLQSKLNLLAEYIAKLGGAAALLLFVVLLIKFLVELRGNSDSASEKAQNFLQILIVAITVVVVAVPEGLPLAVTLALAFATTRMLKDNNLVRVLRACETMGNATTVCSDKTGTLTQNKMSVVAGTISTAFRFGGNESRIANSSGVSRKGKQTAPSESREDVPIAECMSALDSVTKQLIKESIVINSTAFEGEQDGQQTFIGSKTETALLSFAREYLGMGPVNVERSNATVLQLVPFDSRRKCMASIVQVNDGKYRMLIKGASEILLERCSNIIRAPEKGINGVSLSHENRNTLNDVITTYASRSLRTISLAYRDFNQWPPRGARMEDGEVNQVVFEDIFRELTFLGVVGIQDPLRDGVADAVRTCQRAGVYVRMVTGDNILTARAIAEECGIYTAGGLIMEGPKFRKLTRTEMDRIIPRLQVLARSSPEDKRTLVKRLKELGETVAVTGDGTNDAPALKTADVGFSMGIAGTEVAKEASAIILMDDNFSSIVKAIMWGRAVNDSVKKFLQFQVTVNITAVILTFVSAVASADENSVLTAVQLLWVNLIMDTFAALALATDAPTPSVLDRKPDPKSASLISLTMWKMIIGQAIYQLVVTFILNFGGERILSYSTDREKAQLKTLVFNTFVWMQIFNQYNNRRLDNRLNIFEGVLRNYFFIGINIILVAGQIMIVFIGGRAFSVTRLNGAQWGYSIVLGAISIPIAIILRLIPDELLRRLIPPGLRRKATPQVVVSDDDHRFEWNPALEEIREELTFLKRVRGGRLNTLKFKLQHPRDTLLPRSRSGSRSRSNSLPQTPNLDQHLSDFPISMSASGTPESRSRRRGRSRSNSAFGPAAAMAGIIAGSVAGWSPIDHGSSSHDDRSAILASTGTVGELRDQEGIKVHPETAPEDQMPTGRDTTRSTPPSQIPEFTPAPSNNGGPHTTSPPHTPNSSFELQQTSR